MPPKHEQHLEISLLTTHSSLISDLQGHFLNVAVLVKCRELYERHLACGSHIECREPHLASVLNADEEVEDLLFLTDDALCIGAMWWTNT